ncbi:uncharacterized protein LOC108907964 [Anoplophora glabripennis]|uniref:uncharacterized protein LOC108907964 n=1 Tax=Anoplophora glabripennis TaxID=217634 RepID=UPI000873ABB4|nr:uncharacterized protein LOC108907964 [Anoplophora glabripennis]
MRFFLCICAFSAVLSVVYGALAIYPPNPDYPGHCYSKETGQMNYGEEKSLKNCVRANCGSDGSIQLASCGSIGTKCGLTAVDPSKSYPDCCPQPKPCSEVSGVL